MSIVDNLNTIKDNIPSNVTLVLVSKTQPNSNILTAYNAGYRIFGENKIQELQKKEKELPSDIQWHMIGHLQTNKVKYIAPFISLIHSVDSIRLLKEINKRAKENNRIINCLLQVHIAKEKTKYGFKIYEVEEIIEKSKEFTNIKISGIMGMATFTDKTEQINKEFSRINALFKKINRKEINILSIGMSSDYQLALNNGSTMIRVGSAIFGDRN